MKIKKFKSNKKAVLFTLISILMAALFIAMFSYDNEVQLDDKITSTNLRVKILDSYVRDFESYAEDSIDISAYRTLESLTNMKSISGEFFTTETEFNNTFSNCMICGNTTCGAGVLISCGSPLITPTQSYSINDILFSITSIADSQLNIRTEYAINSIKIDQKYTPSDVQISLDISYNISDKTNSYASWHRRQTINKTISIIGLTDPTSSINTEGNYNQPIKMTDICENDATCWNLANFELFYNAHEFKDEDNSTSYLSRFWNSTKYSECCGIESMLNSKNEFIDDDELKSYTDHQYWNKDIACEDLLLFDDIATGFKLDKRVAIKYNITDEGTLLVCP